MSAVLAPAASDRLSPTETQADLKEFAASVGTGATRDMIVGMLLLITAMPEYQLC